ncbi:MAG TPA: glycoside hydrolase family 95 protein [Steroidobacteraceae bacterium]|jgi:alpha-L-fucosidase 2|nr:glycoside hydrolase family 95 protein [Steroidobacteraceae bacterium]
MVTRRNALKGGIALATLSTGTWRNTARAQDPDELRLWYRQPAEAWTEALPIGNGRLGAMVFGGVARERLQLNEDTLYAGGPYDPSDPGALLALPRVRELIAAGRYAEAQALANEKMMARPLRMPSYQTVGNLLLTFGASSFTEGYRRDLDLDTAVARVEYRQDGVNWTREVFASAVDQVIAVRIRADREAAVNLRATFETPMPGAVRVEGDTLILAGGNTSQQGLPAALRYETRVRVIAQGGELVSSEDALTLHGANAVTLLLAIATNYRRFDDVGGDPAAITRRQLEAAAGRGWDQLVAAHIADHRKLFRRVTLDLGRTAASEQPTDLRIRDSATTQDPQLAALYFQYARYLLIACSRTGTQPANLQGLWNDKLSAPWGSKYTININTEMNYWPAEPANLAECVQPLVAMVKDLAVTGARTARVNYGARGWVAHHNTDLWRATAPIDAARYGMWPTGGAWLCQHLWDHYDYGRDRAYLADVYPVMKGAAEFFLDTLVPDPSGKFRVTSPSMSPENNHIDGVSICAGPAMDSQILRDLFAHCIEAAEALHVDAEFRAACAATRARLPPDRIGKGGQLQEWLEDWDLEAPEPNHRHVSHLYALFPSGQINLRQTPELAAAAKRSLELRGDLSTGWAIAWRINLWARLRDAEHTHAVIKLLLDPSRTYPNMFDAHPPFQIDGNFGGANGILEMLVQCVGGEIELLPALPRAWATGSVRGIRTRGGFELDVSWRDGILHRAVLRNVSGGVAHVRYREGLRKVRVRRGASTTLTASQFA